MAYRRNNWLQLTAFPTIWATTWGALSLLSPAGRLVTWSPVLGISAYTWSSQFLGPWGIDFVVASWSVIIAESVRNWIQATPSSDLLIDFEPEEEPYRDDPTAPTEQPSNSRYILALGAFLLVLTIPSYFTPSLPLPTFVASTTPLTVGCALPRTRLANGDFTPALIDDYIAETKKLTAATVVIWPEGAVKFESVKDREEQLEKLRQKLLSIQHGLYVGVSFEDWDPLHSGSRTAMRRNGFVLMNYEGVVLEYYKRNLVPIAESYNMIHSSTSPDVQTISLASPKGTKKVDWDPTYPHLRNISITASICLDFASPASFTSLESRPSIILAPARTWHDSIGSAMWNQARQRAFETGSTVVWCDGGEGGVSGVAGPGHEEPLQVGEGSWITTIGVPYPTPQSRTIFTVIGNFGAMAIVWLICGGGYAIDELLRSGNIEELNSRVREGWASTRAFVDRIRERRREAVAGGQSQRGEEDPLLIDP